MDKDQLKQAVIDLLQGFTCETTPGSAKKIDRFDQRLKPGMVVYVTFLPGSNFQDTIQVCKRLKDEGFIPAPHFAARSIPSKGELNSWLEQLTGEIGQIEQILCIAGGVDQPLGEFSDSMQVLDTGLFDKYGIKQIGVAGHPEGSPDMSDEAIKDALSWKNSFAERTNADLHVVTQFAFEAKPIIEWDKRLQEEGNNLPIYIGVPGLATVKSLLAMAIASGVGPSMRFIKRKALNVTKLLTVADPNIQVLELAKYKANNPNCGIRGVHMYPLGGLKRTAEWTYAVLEGDFSINNKLDGFKVNRDI